jgi:hypothetical protein
MGVSQRWPWSIVVAYVGIMLLIGSWFIRHTPFMGGKIFMAVVVLAIMFFRLRWALKPPNKEN